MLDKYLWARSFIKWLMETSGIFLFKVRFYYTNLFWWYSASIYWKRMMYKAQWRARKWIKHDPCPQENINTNNKVNKKKWCRWGSILVYMRVSNLCCLHRGLLWRWPLRMGMILKVTGSNPNGRNISQEVWLEIISASPHQSYAPGR